jgi:dTDP-4-dehydrorhamnose 3,5-epimerase
MFKKGPIDGIVVKDVKKMVDDRGWLAEIFRHDDLQENDFPVMSYISMTLPGVTRGPHEHESQSDLFCFIGPSNFKLYLWDNRKSSPTYMNRSVTVIGEDSPKTVIIPPGVVHAYKNVGGKHGIIINCPNRLFAGKNKKEGVDEIRYEDDPDTIFKID